MISKKRNMAFLALFIVIVTAVSVIEYRRTRFGYVLPPNLFKPHTAQSDMDAARESTRRVRDDLRWVDSYATRGEWRKAETRLHRIRGDWINLERSTHLTNRRFVDGMNTLQDSIENRDRKKTSKIIGKLDYLIKVLEATF